MSQFKELPQKKPYNSDGYGHPQMRDHEHLLQVLNHLITTAPQWSDKAHRSGIVGLPINAALDWPMGTPSGYALFLDPEVNAVIKKMLNVWGEFLRSPESAAQALGNDANGWFNTEGSKDLTAAANDAAETQHKFEEMFVCDPSKPHHGFNSWVRI